MKSINKYLFAIIVVIVAIVIIKYTLTNKQQRLSTPLRRGTMLESVYGIGVIKASQSFQLKLGVAGQILKIFVKEGASVKKGQKILQLDGAGIIEAPFDGTITYLPVRTGETVFAQAVIYSLVDLNERYITVNLDQRAAVKVQQGLFARVSFDSLRDRVFQGVVESIYSHDNNFLVRIGIKDLPNYILPGMSADVAITINKKENVLMVPMEAIHNGVVTIKQGAREKEISVKVGMIDSSLAEVLEGELNEGDELVLPPKVLP